MPRKKKKAPADISDVLLFARAIEYPWKLHFATGDRREAAILYRFLEAIQAKHEERDYLIPGKMVKKTAKAYKELVRKGYLIEEKGKDEMGALKMARLGQGLIDIFYEVHPNAKSDRKLP